MGGQPLPVARRAVALGAVWVLLGAGPAPDPVKEVREESGPVALGSEPDHAVVVEATYEEASAARIDETDAVGLPGPD